MIALDRVTRFIDDRAAVLEQPRSLIAAAVLRVGIGLYMVFLYVTQFGLRHLIWGGDGMVPLDQLRTLLAGNGGFSLYALAGSGAGFEALYLGGFVASALYVLGVRPRITGIASYVLSYSLYQRNPWLTDGGFNLLIILHFYILFAETGAWFAVDAVRTRAFLATDTPLRRAVGIVHNAALFACALQVAIVYLVAGLYKVAGTKWQDGTALYYIMRSNQYIVFADLSAFVYRNWLLVVLGTYATVAFQLAFAFLIWQRRLKAALIAMAIGLHVGIALFMGLVWFSFVLVIAEVSFLDDALLIAVSQRVTAFLRRFAPPHVGPAVIPPIVRNL